MKILHICQRDDPDEGGSLRVAEGLAREQRASGYDVWLLFLYGPPAAITQDFAPNSVCLELESSRQALKGVGVLGKTIKRIRPDIIHSHEGILWPRLAYLRCDVPVVTHAHLPAGDPNWIKDKLGWPLIKKTTDFLIGISQHTIDSWVEAGYPSSQIHLAPNGVDFDRFCMAGAQAKKTLRCQLGLPVERRIMVWVGRLHREVKGTDRVEGIAKLLPPDVTLVVVGTGTEYSAMVERCRGSIKAGRIVFAGSASCPEQYYSAADAYLFTSYREAFGLVILEAVASGLPILAFPVHDGRGATELLYEFEAVEIDDDASAEAVKGAIEKVLGRRGQTAPLREKAIAKYSWAAVSFQVAGVYEAALNKTKT